MQHSQDVRSKRKGMLRNAHKIRNALRKRQDRNESLQHVIDNSSDLIIRYDSELTHTYINAACQELGGVSRNMLLGKSISEVSVFPENIASDVEKILHSVMKSNTPERVELHWKNKDGSPAFYDLKAVPEHNREGQTIGAFTVAKNITSERVCQIELELKENIEKDAALFQFAYDHGEPAFFLENGRIVYANEALARLLGYTREEIYHLDFKDIDPEYDPEIVTARKRELEKSGKLTYEKKLRCSDGEIITVEITSTKNQFYGRTLLLFVIRDITRRKRKEAALLRSEYEFRTMAENTRSMIARYDVEGRFVYANPPLLQMFGRSLEELKGKSPLESPGLPYAKFFEGKVRETINTGISHFFEHSMCDPDGEIHWAWIEIFPEVDQSGNVKFVQVLTHDISSLKQVEKDRDELQRQLQIIADNLPGAINCYRTFPDGSGQMLYANKGLYDVYGFTLDDLRDDIIPMADRMHPEDLPGAIEKMTNAALTMSTFTGEFRVNHPEKGEIWVEQITTPVYESENSILWYGMMFDITERKRMESALHEQAHFQESLIDAVKRVGMQLMVVENGRVIYHSAPELLRESGYSDDEIAAHPALVDLIHPDDRPRVMDTHRRRLAGEDMPVSYELGTVTRDGQRREWETSVAVVPGSDPVRIITVGKEITARKRIEAALVQREQEFRTLAENTPDTIARYDLDCRRTYINPAFARLAGGIPEKMLGVKPTDLTGSSEAADYERALQRAIDSNESVEHELTWFRHGGQKVISYIRITPERDSEGRVVSVLAIGRDITKMREAEEDLRLKEFIIENAGDAIYVIDSNFNFKYINNETCRTLGYNRNDLLNMSLGDIVGVDPDPEFMKELDDKIRQNGRVIFESVHLRKNGVRFPVEIQSSLLDHMGEQFHISFVRDISERKTMEEQILKREREYRTLAESSPDNIIRVDRDQRVRYLNNSLVRFMGLGSAEELVGKRRDEVWPDGRFAEIDRADRIAMESGETQVIDVALPGENGETLYHQIIIVPERDVSGQVVGTIAFGRDVTSIRESEHRLAHFIENLPGLAYTFRREPDGTQRFTYLSAPVENIFGFGAEEVLDDFEFLHNLLRIEDQKRLEKAIVESARNMTPKLIDLRICQPGKTERWLESRSMPEKQPDGSTHWYGIMLDITERKFTEQYEQFRSHVMEMLSGNHVIRDILEQIVRGVERLNPEMLCSILLLDREGKRLVDGVAPGLPDFYTAAVNGIEIGEGVGSCGTAAATGKRVVVEDIQTHPYWAPYTGLAASAGLRSCWSQPILSSTGKVLGTFAIYHREVNSPTAREITLIEKTARMVSLAIERKRAEDALLHSEQLMRTIIDATPDWIFIKDQEHRFVLVNQGFAAALHMAPEDFIGKDDLELGFPEELVKGDPEKGIRGFWADDRLVMDSNETQVFSDDPATIDGEVHTFHTIKVPLRDDEGKAWGVLAFARDITDRKRMEISLAAREAEFRTLVEQAPEPIFRYALDGRRIYVNDAVERISGMSPDMLLEADAADGKLAHSGNGGQIVELVRKVGETGEPAEIEVENVGADGCHRWFNLRLAPEFGADGKVRSVLTIGHDITERKQAEMALAERQAFLDSLFEAIPVPVFYKDREGRYLGFNRAYETVFGVDRAQLIGKSVFDTHPRELAETYHAKDAEVFERRVELQQYEYQIRHANGMLRDVLFSKAAFSDARGEVKGLIGVVMDITDRKQTQSVIEEVRNRLQAVLKTIPDLVWLKSAEGVYMACNPTFERFFGAAEADIIGKTDYDFLDTELADFFRAKDREALDSGQVCINEEWVTFADDNRRALLETRKVPLFDAEGKVVGVLGISRDITERWSMEQVVRQREQEFRNLAEITPDFIVRYDIEGRHLYLNNSLVEKLDLESSDEVIGKKPSEVWPDGRFDAIEEAARNAVNSGEIVTIEHTFPIATDEDRHSIIRVAPEKDTEGNIIGSIAFGSDITEIKRMEWAIRASELRFRNNNRLLHAILESSPDVIVFALDTEYRYIAFNQKHRDTIMAIWGREIDLGMNMLDLFGDHLDREKAKGGMDRALSGESFVIEEVYGREERSRLHWRNYWAPIHSDKGEIIGLTCFVMNISERKQMEIDLREQKEFMASVLKAIGDVNVQLMGVENGVITYLGNRKIALDFGFSDEEIDAGIPLVDILHPDNRDRVISYYRSRLNNEDVPDTYELSLITKDGQRIEYETSVTLIPGTNPVRVMNVARDITERKQMEEILDLNIQKFQAAFRQSPAGLTITSLYSMRFLDVNDVFSLYIGFNREEISGKTHEELGFWINDSERKRFFYMLQEYEQVSDFKFSYKRKDGEIRRAIASATRIETINDLLALTQILDITDQERQEIALKKSRESLAEAQRIAKVGNWELDLKNDQLTWSDEIYRIFEIDRGEFGDSYESFIRAIHPDDRDAVNEAYTRSLENHTPYEIEHRLILPGERIKYVLERGETIYNNDGKAIRSVGTVQDITDRKLMEQQLALKEKEAARMRGQKEFLTNISHEMRTPLNAILGFSEVLEKKLHTKGDISFVQSIRNAGTILHTLINDFLDLSRIESGQFKLQWREADPERILEEIHSLYSVKSTQTGIDFFIERGTELPGRVLIDDQRLKQILVNLLDNSFKFTFEGYIRLNMNFINELHEPEKGTLFIDVEDSGIGIPENERERVFEPFVQLAWQKKEPNSGTGLGLAIVSNLLNSMGGKISLSSGQCGGALFRLEIPVKVIEQFNKTNTFAREGGYDFLPSIILHLHKNSARKDALLAGLEPFPFYIIQKDIAKSTSVPGDIWPDLILIDREVESEIEHIDWIIDLNNPELAVPVIILCEDESAFHSPSQAGSKFKRSLKSRDSLLESLSLYLPQEKLFHKSSGSSILPHQQRQRDIELFKVWYDKASSLSGGAIEFHEISEFCSVFRKEALSQKAQMAIAWTYQMQEAIGKYNLSGIQSLWRLYKKIANLSHTL